MIYLIIGYSSGKTIESALPYEYMWSNDQPV